MRSGWKLDIIVKVESTGFTDRLDVVCMKEKSKGWFQGFWLEQLEERGLSIAGNQDFAFGHIKFEMIMSQEKISLDIC